MAQVAQRRFIILNLLETFLIKRLDRQDKHGLSFITPAVAVGASYLNANAVNADLDTQTVGVNAKFRF